MSGTAARRAISAKPSAARPMVSPNSRVGPSTQSRPRYTGGGLPRQALYVAIDVAMVSLGACAMYWLRFGGTQISLRFFLSPVQLHAVLLHGYGGFLVLYAGLIMLACLGQNLYRTPREWTSLAETLAVSRAVGLATALLVLFIFTSGNKEISRLVVACSGITNIATLSGWRFAKRRYVSRRLRQGVGTRRALIVGAGRIGKELAACFEQNYELGYEVCGFLDVHPNGDSRVLGTVADLRRVALAKFADEIFVTAPTNRKIVEEAFVQARSLRIDMHLVPDLYDGLARHAPLHAIGGFPAMLVHGQPIPAVGLATKRFLDIALGTVALILACPILTAAAIWIRLDSPGPILYPAFRMGKKGKKFQCFKLRTMVVGADAAKEKLRAANERTGPFFKMESDPRVTRSGRWLRKFSIDELPQLLNVLRGEMSLVGPRPHPVDDFIRYTVEDLRRLDVQPGVTGLWQVTARRDPSFETNMALDLEYIEKWSLGMDIKIMLKTIPAVLRAEGS
jgi:exopolysaccharide biosynthesis polyprenyl glycosylphosphotransferase